MNKVDSINDSVFVMPTTSWPILNIKRYDDDARRAKIIKINRSDFRRMYRNENGSMYNPNRGCLIVAEADSIGFLIRPVKNGS
jgi:hypothetical protein